jgi:hypothetical protein
VQGLQELSFVEGRDFDIEYRFTDGLVDRSGVLAEELLTLKPNVIFAAITPAVVAARALTQTVPIVCPLLVDPIRFGLIASEARPAGNVTGVLSRVDGLAGKQLEFGLKVVPDATRVGMLVNALSGIITDRQEVEQASQTLGIKLISAEVHAPDDIDKAFPCSSTNGSESQQSQRQPDCRRSSASALMSMPAALSATGSISLRASIVPPPTSFESSKAPSRAICRWNFRPSSSLSSTSKPQKRSD